MTRALAIAIGLAAFAALGWWFGWDGVAEALRRVSPAALAVYLALTVLAWGGATTRWWVVARAVDGAGAPGRMFGARLGGDAVGALVPSGRLAGEPLRVALVRGGRVTTSAATAGVALDRMLELTGNMLAGLTYVVVFATVREAGAAPWLLGALLVAGLALLALPVATLARGGHPFAWCYGPRARQALPRAGRWLDAVQRVEAHLGAGVRAHPRRLLLGLSLTVATEALLVAQYHTLLGAFGVALDLPTLLLVMLGGGIANAAPTPAGLGALEAAQVLAVGAATGQPELGFVVGIILRLHMVLLLAAGGVALLWLGTGRRGA